MPDAPSFTEAAARDSLAEACPAADLDPAGAELIRLGSNAVFRLRAPVIARVTRSLDQAGDARRQIEVARWLADKQVPVIRPLDVPQPIATAGRVVTLWESANDREEYGSVVELGAILRRLHSLDPPTGIDLPRLVLLERIAERADRMAGVAQGDRAFLRDRAGELAAAYEGVTFDLAPGVIHGDANVGNLLRDKHGTALLMDLDSFAIGPREWDLIQTAIFYDRFGWHSESEYREFVAAYGYDVMQWDGYSVLRNIRELYMVVWLSQNVADPASRREFDKRMRTLRTDGSAQEWSPL